MIIKKIALILFVAAISFTCVFCARSAIGTENAYHAEREVMTVVIDAGHGGIDGGVTGSQTGVKESDLNLLISKELAECFKSGGFKVVMTRTSAAGLYGVATRGFKMRDMEKRKSVINGANADLMISVHLNKFSSPSRRGAQAFYKIGDENSKALADSIQAEFNSAGEREYSALEGDYYVLNESLCTSVLCECGFLSNPEDEKLLLTDEHRKKVAYRIYKGAIAYLLK